MGDAGVGAANISQHNSGQGPLIGDGYRVERELGSGGMATVYLAEDLKHHRQVAVKVIKPSIASVIGDDRFLREIEVTARLNHPNILPLFDSGASSGRLFYVMPYITGESLRARLDREKRLPLETALRLVRDIAAALAYAHQQGIVHRDVKPENILLSDDVALMADFGLARVIDAAAHDAGQTLGATVIGSIVGTPAYMSPEQATGGEADPRSDVYSLGCVLFEMLAGRPPFVANSAAAMVRMHLAEVPPALTEMCDDVSAGLSHAISTCLAKAPSDRFPTMTGLIEALTAAGAATTVVLPSSRPPAASPTNLPKPRTHFVARHKELVECDQLLADVRLLTITGIGGCGKTRLALRVAERLLRGFHGGVWFVDLAPLTDGSRVEEAVAKALGVTESPGELPLETLKRAVTGTSVLLVLDNCEHVLGATANLVDALLAATDSVRILATSREGLGIDGERLYALRSLAVPAADEARTRSAVGAYDSVQLFVDRAQLAVRDFALTDQNVAAVAEVCRRLDGIPLAIELAAARVRVLSVEQIRDKLDDRFRLLTGGSKTALPRHQTLRAMIQWSYDQLSAVEQRLFRTLAVFSGGWTLEQATGLAGEWADEFEVLELLGRLIDKSLVLVDRDGSTEPRYRMLETVRQYASERLGDAGDGVGLRRRHAAHFLAFAERAYAERLTRTELWTPRLEAEHDNLRAALEFLQHADSTGYLALAGSLGWFWQARSHLFEGRAHLRTALKNSAPDATPARARALWAAANLLSWQGDAATARPLMQEALQIWRDIGDTRETALALEGIGWTQFLAGEDEAAYETFDESLRLQIQDGDAHLVNRAKVAVAQVLVALGRGDRARPLATEIITFSKTHGDKGSEHFGWHFLADCALMDGACAESLRLYREALGLAHAIGDRLETSFELQGLAMSYAGLGRSEHALRLNATAVAEWERIGANPHVRFWEALLHRYLDPVRDALGVDAIARLSEEGRRISFDEAVSRELVSA